ncbi:MAG TPA: Ig-like domain repeat protein, partial [Verrucomicrobiae bacterium]|nr:Ig-like domain repeat protein [Verrucomicrobiae bacterium]
ASNYAFGFVDGQLMVTPAQTTNIVSASANPVPTGSNVVFTATISAVAPSLGTATGSAEFVVDGAAFGSPIALSGGAASLSTAGLSHGYHVVGALYAGDTNFIGSTNNSIDLLVNRAPVGGAHPLATTQNKAVSFASSKLAGLDNDPDGDALSITGVNLCTNGGTASLVAGTITYVPPADYVGPDSFTYTLADSYGATATGTVNVTVKAANLSGVLNQLARQPDGSVRVTASGLPGQTYLIQASEDLKNWLTIGTNQPYANGLILFQDQEATNYPSRYYRLAAP